MNVNKGNEVRIVDSSVNNSSVYVSHSDNVVMVDRALVEDSLITIEGVGNRLEIEEGVKLRKTRLIIRGHSCIVKIGKNTSFGQIRIVNVGERNVVEIGEGCLFADNIELWASDTHSIYDDKGNFINPEKPIKIGDNVWVGSFVKILKGVTIENGAVIGMNSLVTKDIRSNTLNVGSPAQCVKENIHWKLEYENE